MSLEMELRHLELANRHIAECQQRIAEQKVRIARVERRGRDTATSNELLEVFQETLKQMMRHRDLILRELAQNSN
jgi:translation initiation factor 1 (eIF-1/SUI1)